MMRVSGDLVKTHSPKKTGDTALGIRCPTCVPLGNYLCPLEIPQGPIRWGERVNRERAKEWRALYYNTPTLVGNLQGPPPCMSTVKAGV